MTWQRVGRAVGTVSVGGVLVAVAQSPTGPVLAPALGPVVAALLAVLTGLAVMVVLTVLVLVLTSALSRDPLRQENAAAAVDLIVYAVHRRCRPDLDLAPLPHASRRRGIVRRRSYPASATAVDHGLSVQPATLAPPNRGRRAGHTPT